MAKKIYTLSGTIGSIDYTKGKNGNIEIVDIHTGRTDNGECFKAPWNGSDIIYVSEYGAIDFANREDNGVQFEDIAWTRKSWIDWVRNEIAYTNERIAADERFIEYLAEMIFDDCDWQDLATRLCEYTNYNDIEETYNDYLKR